MFGIKDQAEGRGRQRRRVGRGGGGSSVNMIKLGQKKKSRHK